MPISISHLLRSAGLAAVAVLADARAAQPGDSRLLLSYDRGAHEWEEALPVGNGRSGAMVQGGIAGALPAE